MLLYSVPDILFSLFGSFAFGALIMYVYMDMKHVKEIARREELLRKVFSETHTEIHTLLKGQK